MSRKRRLLLSAEGNFYFAKDGEVKEEPTKDRQVFIGMMPGGTHYYVSDSEDTDEFCTRKFPTFDEAYKEALKRVPPDKIVVRDAKKFKRPIIGD